MKVTRWSGFCKSKEITQQLPVFVITLQGLVSLRTGSKGKGWMVQG